MADLSTGQIYHIFNKSIAKFEIFRNNSEYERMKGLLKYYQTEKLALRFSHYAQRKRIDKDAEVNISGSEIKTGNSLVDVIAYCVMPTHIHLAIKQLVDNGISTFMRKILDSYTRYFNTKIKRQGPLWAGRFKRVLVANDEQLLHLTRYIHLNPTTAYLVNNPQDWHFSSYGEFLNNVEDSESLCRYSSLLDIKPDSYKEFVDSRTDYQRTLAKIKHLLLD